MDSHTNGNTAVQATSNEEKIETLKSKSNLAGPNLANPPPPPPSTFGFPLPSFLATQQPPPLFIPPPGMFPTFSGVTGAQFPPPFVPSQPFGAPPPPFAIPPAPFAPPNLPPFLGGPPPIHFAPHPLDEDKYFYSEVCL